MELGRKLLTCAFAGVVGSMLLAPETASAQNTGNISLSGGVDVVTEYWYRGIAQENQGILVQPELEVGVTTTDNTYLYFGTWNSIHGQTNGPSDGWYEADWYVGGGIDIDNFNVDLSYVNLYNPDGGSSFSEEIALGVSYDDSDLWGEGAMPALNPFATLILEVDAGSDGLGAAGDEGVLLELGVEPSFRVVESDTYPIDLSIPFVIGLDINDDYYENAAGKEDTFGYGQLGVVAEMPLDELVPADYGSWSASAGLHAVFTGDAAQEIAEVDFGVTGDGDFSIFGSFGIGFEY